MKNKTIQSAKAQIVRLGLIVCLGVAGGAALAGCADSPAHESLGQAISDRAVTMKVQAALIADPATKVRRIKVQTFRGVVELSGFIRTDYEHSEALRVARHQPGVHRVEDNLQPVPLNSVASVTDADLNARVRAALAISLDSSHRKVQVITSHGIVELSGFVGSPSERLAAGQAAEGVQGVVRVNNGLQLEAPPQPRLMADNDPTESAG